MAVVLSVQTRASLYGMGIGCVLTVVCTPLPPINMIATLIGQCFQCFLPV